MDKLILNAKRGKTTYSVKIPQITVSGEGVADCVDSVVEYISDHAEELFVESGKEKAKKFVVTAVDYGDTCDGKARVIGVFDECEKAVEFVKSDIAGYVDNGTIDGECTYDEIDYEGMSVFTDNHENGCEWNIEEVAV